MEQSFVIDVAGGVIMDMARSDNNAILVFDLNFISNHLPVQNR